MWTEHFKTCNFKLCKCEFNCINLHHIILSNTIHYLRWWQWRCWFIFFNVNSYVSIPLFLHHQNDLVLTCHYCLTVAFPNIKNRNIVCYCVSSSTSHLLFRNKEPQASPVAASFIYITDTASVSQKVTLTHGMETVLYLQILYGIF